MVPWRPVLRGATVFKSKYINRICVFHELFDLKLRNGGPMKNWAKPGPSETSNNSPSHRLASEWVSKQASKRTSAAERASKASSVEQTNERAVRANERTDEQVAQYLRLDSAPLWSVVTVHLCKILFSFHFLRLNLSGTFVTYYLLPISVDFWDWKPFPTWFWTCFRKRPNDHGGVFLLYFWYFRCRWIRNWLYFFSITYSGY